MVCDMNNIERCEILVDGKEKARIIVSVEDEGTWVKYSDVEKKIKSLTNLLAVKDEGMKALQEEVDRLTDDLKEIATLIDFKLGYSGYDSDRCKAERDWLMKELVLMVFRECKEPTTKDTLIANIEYSMDNALRGGEDE